MAEVEMGSVAVESSNIKSDSNPPPAYLGASTGKHQLIINPDQI